jgi:tRNA pseudouridine32 synthase / 23S rRNA pseudouridine746 synthase
VLVVRTTDDQYSYLSAFSGKLAGGNHHPGFVPPVFDSLADDSFLNEGMRELGRINERLAKEEDDRTISQLQDERRRHSNGLQHRLFAEYRFTNSRGVLKDANEIFRAAGYRNPPSGAGECAGPKLLQYAFQNSLEPVALAEFWWGKSPKSAQWVHKQYYPCCREKCAPILAHMLS